MFIMCGSDLMKYHKGQLIISNTDFDHIMSWSDNKVPSEAFKEGLEVELFMNGLDNKNIRTIKIDFN